ncbi:MAG: response regulator transcription factor [Lachnospiraceae bacterium]|nr:response regulator transcription factor [Lachnospiraceae bacterium]
MNYQCLIVDDDITIAENTAEYFNIFDVSTYFVTSYEDAVTFLDENEVSLILLDINLGDGSGFELCKRIRKDYDMPILFISARKSDDNILTALNIGGDDFISKPYSLNIIFAKVKAVLSRYERSVEKANVKASATSPENALKEQERLTISPEIYIDTYSHKLMKSGESISLKVKEYKMLLYLLENKGRVITKDELLKSVWEDEFIGEGTLSVHARHLREKIEKDPNNPEIIKTVWGVGYIIES